MQYTFYYFVLMHSYYKGNLMEECFFRYLNNLKEHK